MERDSRNGLSIALLTLKGINAYYNIWLGRKFAQRTGLILRHFYLEESLVSQRMASQHKATTLEPSISPYWNDPFWTGFKRALDITVSGALLVLLAPLLLALAAAVKLTSPGPVLYRWRVVGSGGRRFTGYKFRSMCQNADELKPQLEAMNEMDGPVFKLTRDPRITTLGAWMRRYSLDELPQLYSVLKGDMSLVGPRPPLVSEYDRFDEFQKQKLAVKPGITCLWQVSGRNNIKDFDEWVKLDLDYIRSWSPTLDFRILAKTAAEVFTGSGK